MGHFRDHRPSQVLRRRDGRVAEGARLESVFTRKGNVGSNPTLSAILTRINTGDYQRFVDGVLDHRLASMNGHNPEIGRRSLRQAG